MPRKPTSEDKRKHLEFIQNVINRLSSNTFLFKGWSITVIVAVFTAMLTTGNNTLLWLCFGVVLIFWCIDAYYLMLERAYRKLYDKIAETAVEKIDYKMGVKNFIGFSAWLKAFERPILLMFYGAILIAVVCLLIGNNFDISLTVNIRE